MEHGAKRALSRPAMLQLPQHLFKRRVAGGGNVAAGPASAVPEDSAESLWHSSLFPFLDFSTRRSSGMVRDHATLMKSMSFAQFCRLVSSPALAACLCEAWSQLRNCATSTRAGAAVVYASRTARSSSAPPMQPDVAGRQPLRRAGRLTTGQPSGIDP